LHGKAAGGKVRTPADPRGIADCEPSDAMTRPRAMRDTDHPGEPPMPSTGAAPA
jgi:hypothetical protein